MASKVSYWSKKAVKSRHLRETTRNKRGKRPVDFWESLRKNPPEKSSVKIEVSERWDNIWERYEG